MILMDWGTFLHTTPFGGWSSIGGVHLVLCNLIAIYQMQSALQLLHSSARFLIVIILWLLPWWAFASILVIINTFHLLDFSKHPFKVSLCWLVAVSTQGFSNLQLGRQIGRGFLSFVCSPAGFQHHAALP
jgi:hypothetical protein